MFDYSKINKESLKSDLNQTIENSKNFDYLELKRIG